MQIMSEGPKGTPPVNLLTSGFTAANMFARADINSGSADVHGLNCGGPGRLLLGHHLSSCRQQKAWAMQSVIIPKPGSPQNGRHTLKFASNPMDATFFFNGVSRNIETTNKRNGRCPS